MASYVLVFAKEEEDVQQTQEMWETNDHVENFVSEERDVKPTQGSYVVDLAAEELSYIKDCVTEERGMPTKSQCGVWRIYQRRERTMWRTL